MIGVACVAKTRLTRACLAPGTAATLEHSQGNPGWGPFSGDPVVSSQHHCRRARLGSTCPGPGPDPGPAWCLLCRLPLSRGASVTRRRSLGGAARGLGRPALLGHHRPLEAVTGAWGGGLGPGPQLLLLPVFPVSPPGRSGGAGDWASPVPVPVLPGGSTRTTGSAAAPGAAGWGRGSVCGSCLRVGHLWPRCC